MAAWRRYSPYRAYGVYLGGVNAACYPEPNLTSSWVSTVVAAGWKLLPLYVGLQAPNNECGCWSMSSSATSAASQGTAAANDAVTKAKALGIGTGAPIYDDMEGYTTGSPNTPPVLAFLQAWAQQLHALGYVAGVYTGAYTGVTDLVGQYGTGYVEPDDIWWAYWNGVATTSCSCIPSGDWAHHQRLKQYASPGNQTYGGVTLNIDENYLDGLTWGNPIPTCQSVSVSTAADTPVTVPLRCRDAAGAKLTYFIATAPADGQLDAIDQSTATVTYTPDAGYVGSDRFTYRASSVNGSSHSAAVTITVS
jgi:hypothetical protein